MSYLWSFAGLAIGLFGLYSWYVETYTDSSIAALWREMGDRNDRTTSGDSLSPLLIWLFAFEGVGVVGGVGRVVAG